MNDRRCCICDEPIRRGHARQVTCGHPRCVRTNRAAKSVAARKRAPKPAPMTTAEREAMQARPDYAVRWKITNMVRLMLDAGLSEAAAIDRVATVGKWTRAEVLSTWRAAK
jgi:hypothetical protein